MQQSTGQVFREVPRNLTAEQLANSLQAAAPTLNFNTAYAVAKSIIGAGKQPYQPSGETKSADGSRRPIDIEA